MKRRAFMLLLVSALLLAESKTPARQWQAGKFKDAESGQYDVPASPNGGALTRAVSLLKGHSYTDYVIESDQYVLRVELKGSAHVIVNGDVKFSIEGLTLWFIDADGKERKAKLLKQVLKEPAK
jgi:hypothetical protein